MASKASTSNSGIRQLGNGEAVIPASTRPDGSVRKEIRVKPGYKPPEDVEVYRNRTAEAWRNKDKGGVPGAEMVEDEKESPHKAAARNAKRREARKKAAEAKGGGETAVGEASADDVAVRTNGEGVEAKQEEIDPDVEKSKEARKLAKKLRQARELQEKKDKGDSLLPEQMAKVIKINELIRQLESLGFDAEGEKKEQDDESTAD